MYFIFLPLLFALSATLTVIVADLLTAKLVSAPATGQANGRQKQIVQNPA